MTRTALLAAFVAGACAGGTHVHFPSPPPDLPPDSRVDWFMKLKPQGEQVKFESGDNGANWHLYDRTLQLANTTRVGLPEDLIPLVREDSATAAHARASARSRTKGNIANGTAFAIGLGMLGFYWGTGSKTGWLPLGALVVGAVGFGIGRHYFEVELDERKQAFAAYTRDLGERLNVCAHGTQVVACDGPLPEAPSNGPATSLPERTGMLHMRER